MYINIYLLNRPLRSSAPAEVLGRQRIVCSMASRKRVIIQS